MNIDKIDSLFAPSASCLSTLQEDVVACLFILKDCWPTEEILLTLNEAQNVFDSSLETPCTMVYEKCKNTLLELFKRLDDVGLDDAFFNLLIARRYLKTVLNKTQ